MAREYARWNVTASGDDDWRALPWAAQWLYKTLWDHPKLTYCGVLDWRPGRIAAAAAGMDAATVRSLAQCLEARLFVVIDEDTEEMLIRSWARFDGLMRQPRMAVSFATAFAAVESATVRGVLVHEARKIREREPELAGWAKPEVAELLGRKAIDPRSRVLPADPFESGFPAPLGPASPSVSVSFGPNASGPLGHVSVPPTPSPAPTPSLLLQEPAPATAVARRGTRIPDPFPITPEMVAWARDNAPGIDHRAVTERFVDYWRGVSGGKGVKADWVATWRNWLRRESEAHGRPSPARRGTTDQRVEDAIDLARRLAAEEGAA